MSPTVIDIELTILDRINNNDSLVRNKDKQDQSQQFYDLEHRTWGVVRN